MKTKTAIAMSCLIVVLSVHSAWAAYMPAIAFTSRASSNTAAGYTLGWEFTINQDLLVTHLGSYDADADGLLASHDVGIFAIGGGAPLVSATVAAGTGEEAVGNTVNSTFRYHDITDFLLVQGTYRIGGTSSGGDLWTAEPTGLTEASGVDVLQGAYIFTNTSDLTYPANDNPGVVYAGPNFMFFVPEPSMLVILPLIASGFLARRRATLR